MRGWIAWILKRSRCVGYRVARWLWLNRAHAAMLESILSRYPERPVIIFHPGLEWNMPLFQRPQHMAIQLGQHGALYFYATPNAKYDHCHGFKEVGAGCFLTDRFDLLSKLKCKRKYLHLYSSDMSLDYERLIQLKEEWGEFVYEYIDELHPDLSKRSSAPSIIHRHNTLINDSSVRVVATAQRLFDDASRRRNGCHNICLIGNGADCAHFGLECRNIVNFTPALKDFLEHHSVRIGYFGAFASWFDYELIRKLAIGRPEYGILLIGTDFDGTMGASAINKLSNVFFAGIVPYTELPVYANTFTVGIVPFIVNDITLSTSPIKLFEYMAAGLPVVSTDLPECRNIPEVNIAKSSESFLLQIDECIRLSKLPETAAKMKSVSIKHDWSSKAKALLLFLGTAK